MYVDLRRFIFLKSLESGLFTGVLKTFVGLREFYKWNPHNETFGLNNPAIGELWGLIERERLEILQNILQFSPFILQNNAE